MNKSIKCEISLSKKLRSIIQENSSMTLIANDIRNGRGSATLVFDSDRDINIDTLGETSIMITAVEVTDSMIGDNLRPHSNIFVDSKNSKNDSVINKIAVTKPPEDHEIRARNYKTSTPEEFKEIDVPECQNWISNITQLIDVVQKAVKTKKSNIDINTAKNEREKLVLMEQIEKEEAIDVPAWIVNKKAGGITVNDLGISLPLNVPFDLSRISAKRILSSKDLKSLINAGFIEFIDNKNEKNQLFIDINKQIDGGDGGLEVYGNKDDAMDAIGESTRPKTGVMIDEVSSVDVSGEDVTEDEQMIMDLTQGRPETRNEPLNVNPTTSHHGSSKPSSSKPAIRKKF